MTFIIPLLIFHPVKIKITEQKEEKKKIMKSYNLSKRGTHKITQLGDGCYQFSTFYFNRNFWISLLEKYYYLSHSRKLSP